MPCYPILSRTGKQRIGFICVGNEPVEVDGYLFEWTRSSGWLAVNKDGSERLSRVPNRVWEKVWKLPRPGEESKDA